MNNFRTQICMGSEAHGRLSLLNDTKVKIEFIWSSLLYVNLFLVHFFTYLRVSTLFMDFLLDTISVEPRLIYGPPRNTWPSKQTLRFVCFLTLWIPYLLFALLVSFMRKVFKVSKSLLRVPSKPIEIHFLMRKIF